MGKGKRPRKPQPPTPDESPSRDEELEAVSLPQRRIPPLQRRSPEPVQPVLLNRMLHAVRHRNAVGVMLDIADAAAEAITKRLEGPA